MKQKGFSLIELLGVMVLLGVIALIVYPAIGSMLEDSKKGSLTNSARGIIKTFKQLYVPYVGREMIYNFETKEMTVDGEIVDETFIVKGVMPEVGYIKSDSNGKISLFTYQDDYCITQTLNDNDVVLRKVGKDSTLCVE